MARLSQVTDALPSKDSPRQPALILQRLVTISSSPLLKAELLFDHPEWVLYFRSDLSLGGRTRFNNLPRTRAYPVEHGVFLLASPP